MLPLGAPLLGAPAVSDEVRMDPNIIDLQRWRDFNDAPPQPAAEPFMHLDPEPAQIATFFDVVFGYLEGWIPLRGFIDKGQGADGKPHNGKRGLDTLSGGLALSWLSQAPSARA